MSKNRRGILLLTLGVVMVAASVGLHYLQQRQDQLAGESSAILLEELNREISPGAPSYRPTEADTTEEFEVVPAAPVSVEAPSVSAPVVEESGEPTVAEEVPYRTLSGYDVMGVLKVPSVYVELPILSNWSDSLLNVAPCRYSGSLETGNLILMGHNYKSHLQPLGNVRVGDSVEFTDANGVVHRFRVAMVEEILGSTPEKLASEHPLILFTCTFSRHSRIVVRCEAV